MSVMESVEARTLLSFGRLSRGLPFGRAHGLSSRDPLLPLAPRSQVGPGWAGMGGGVGGEEPTCPLRRAAPVLAPEPSSVPLRSPRRRDSPPPQTCRLPRRCPAAKPPLLGQASQGLKAEAILVCWVLTLSSDFFLFFFFRKTQIPREQRFCCASSGPYTA